MNENEDNSTDQTDDSIRTVPPNADPIELNRALAAQIGDRNVWIANSGGVAPLHLESMGLDPEYVISVNQAATDATTDHYPLKDGYVNDQDRFNDAVDSVRNGIRNDGVVIVNCAAGISRSTTVAATAIAAENDCGFDNIVEEIKQTRHRARPHPKLRVNAYAYLAINKDRNDSKRKFKQLTDEISINRLDDDIVEKLPLSEG